MTTASLLSFLSAAFAIVAFAFVVIGLGRTVRITKRPFGQRKPAAGVDGDRLRIVQSVDWGCAAGLAGAALLAFVESRVGTGSAFTEPSGNAAGGFLLLTVIVLVVVLLTLLFRHVIVSRALRSLNDSERASRFG